MFQLKVNRKIAVLHLRMKESRRIYGYQHLNHIVIGLPGVKSQRPPQPAPAPAPDSTADTQPTKQVYLMLISFHTHICKQNF